MFTVAMAYDDSDTFTVLFMYYQLVDLSLLSRDRLRSIYRL